MNLEDIKKYFRDANYHMSDEEIEQVYSNLDQNKDGLIDYNEFVQASMDQQECLKEENLKVAFELLDKDGSGTLSIEELRAMVEYSFCEKEVTQEQLQEYMNLFDSNDDGVICFHEYKRMVTKKIEHDDF